MPTIEPVLQRYKTLFETLSLRTVKKIFYRYLAATSILKTPLTPCAVCHTCSIFFNICSAPCLNHSFILLI